MWPPAIRRPPRSLEAVALAAIAALPVLLTLPFLSEPLFGDEGVYSVVARGLLDGELPYRDLFDNKGPLLYAWYSLSFLLWGESAEAPRLLAALLLSATVLLVYVEGRLLLSRGAAFAAASIFALSPAVLWVGSEAASELFMLAPLTGSLVAFTLGARGGRLRWFVLAGLLGGVAALTKQTALVNLLALTLLAAAAGTPVGAPRFRAVAALGAGAAISALVTGAPFLLLGAARDVFDGTVLFNLALGSHLSLADRLSLFGGGMLVLTLAAGALLLAAGRGVLVLARRRGPAQRTFLVWASASLAGIVLATFFFPHYFVTVLPALALLSAANVDEPPRWPRAGLARVATIAVGATVGALVLLNVGLGLTPYVASTAEARHLSRSTNEQRAEGENLNRQLAAYLSERTTPEETLHIHGGGTMRAPVYFYADRRPATRYFYATALRTGDGSRADEALATLRAEPPRYIVDASVVEYRYAIQGGSDAPPPGLRQLLDERYHFVGTIHRADVYRLRPE
ncbi:MAG: glycosyltransferase family 39 protein [Chloroflexi bacterium]|nr:glycosyltransferase family 39 protein [Chloroflexota bacterium]